jgi:hypothetical protein
MRTLALAAAMSMTGCGGGSSNNNGTGAVDPASLDFCIHWANGVCRLAYLCVDASSQDATFHARYGTGMDSCWQGLQKLCTSNQTGAQTFGPSCGPGKVVNQALSMACTDDLDSQSCNTWMSAQAGNCGGVCASGTSVQDGGAALDAPLGNDVGSPSGTGSVATATAFCNTEGSLNCDRAFECEPAKAASTFGNIAGCKNLLASLCASGDPCPSGFDPNLASACVAATKAATCQELMGTPPAVCTSACPDSPL